MKQIQTDLWETEVEHPAPGLTTRAYLLLRSSGNILFYNTRHLHEIEHMARLGGVAYQFLSHKDELSQSIVTIRNRFQSKLGGSAFEQEEFSRICRPALLFEERAFCFPDLEVIPTPGHTAGSTCFLATSTSGKRYLFTGDTIYLNKAGNWEAGFIPGFSDRDALIRSLGLLQGLLPAVVLSSGSDGGGGYQEMSPQDWISHVAEAREGLG